MGSKAKSYTFNLSRMELFAFSTLTAQLILAIYLPGKINVVAYFDIKLPCFHLCQVQVSLLFFFGAA